MTNDNDSKQSPLPTSNGPADSLNLADALEAVREESHESGASSKHAARQAMSSAHLKGLDTLAAEKLRLSMGFTELASARLGGLSSIEVSGVDRMSEAVARVGALADARDIGQRGLAESIAAIGDKARRAIEHATALDPFGNTRTITSAVLDIQQTLDRIAATRIHEMERYHATFVTARTVDSYLQQLVTLSKRLPTENMLAPLDAFAHFTVKTDALLSASDDARRSLALSASVTAGASLLQALGDLACRFTQPRFDAVWAAMASIEVFERQQYALLRTASTSEIDSEHELIDATAECSIQVLGLRVAAATIIANESSKLRGGDAIFARTDATFAATIGMLSAAVETEEGFRDLIRKLYVVFYEGCGAASLRFLKENGGPLPQDDPLTQFVWDIKHLRNKWASHDPDHGTEGEIRKNWRGLQKALAGLGIGTLPRTKDEYLRAQRSLLEQAADFAEAIVRKLE